MRQLEMGNTQSSDRLYRGKLSRRMSELRLGEAKSPTPQLLRRAKNGAIRAGSDVDRQELLVAREEVPGRLKNTG